MNKLNLRIVYIISCALIVIGMVIGTVLHFVVGGFFNYGGEFSGYRSVTVAYSVVEVNGVGDDFDLKTICDEAFAAENVSYYAQTEDSAKNSGNGVLRYRFDLNTDSAALDKAVESINGKIAESVSAFEDTPKTKAVCREEVGVLGEGFSLWRAAVALTVIVVAQLIYTMIRLRFSAAFAAIAVDLHNLALYAALLAICRVPVDSTAIVIAVLITLVTAIGVTFTLEKVKRSKKDSANENLPIENVVYSGAKQTLKMNVALPVFVAITAILFFAITAISSMSFVTALVPSLAALLGLAVTVYGDLLFAPAIYLSIKKAGYKISAPSLKKGD